MYVHLTSGHFPLTTELHIEKSLSGGTGADAVSIACHFGDVYVSFPPGEARAVAEKLLAVALEAEAAQQRIDAFAARETAEAVA